LIEVPYWWDRRYESLEATIYAQRPDLFEKKPKENPIPSSPTTVQKLTLESKTHF
jgi:hypothetical protein